MSGLLDEPVRSTDGGDDCLARLGLLRHATHRTGSEDAGVLR